MTFQRRFAPIGGRFDPESLAGLTGIYIIVGERSHEELIFLVNHRLEEKRGNRGWSQFFRPFAFFPEKDVSFCQASRYEFPFINCLFPEEKTGAKNPADIPFFRSPRRPG
jgi:hypothetical protein